LLPHPITCAAMTYSFSRTLSMAQGLCGRSPLDCAHVWLAVRWSSLCADGRVCQSHFDMATESMPVASGVRRPLRLWLGWGRSPRRQVNYTLSPQSMRRQLNRAIHLVASRHRSPRSVGMVMRQPPRLWSDPLLTHHGNHAGAVYLPGTHNGSNCPAIRLSFDASRVLRRCHYACVVRMAAGSWREARHRPSAGLHKPDSCQLLPTSSWFSHDDVGWTNLVQLTNRPRRRAAWTSRSTCRGPADRGSARPVSGRCHARGRQAGGRGQPRSRTR